MRVALKYVVVYNIPSGGRKRAFAFVEGALCDGDSQRKRCKVQLAQRRRGKVGALQVKDDFAALGVENLELYHG